MQGVTYHNDDNETEPASTPMIVDFAQSCNNAFDQWWPSLQHGQLAITAQRYYGLNEPWDTGIGQSATYYRTPPGATGSEVAMEAFGDGAISASPLAVVTSGTAAGLGFWPDVYAKTGTADINGRGRPNSWFVAFGPGRDVAVACLVLDAGQGADYAAPEARSFLSRYSA